jgi:hypothetical protein
MAPRPKRHHQVPRAYLERFAVDGKVRVLRRDGKTFDTNPINVAAESGFYDVTDDLGEKSSVVESLLESVETAAHVALGEIDRSRRPPDEGSQDREALARFVAFQMTRTSQHREQVMFPVRVMEWAGDRSLTRELLAEYLEHEHLGFAPDDREVEGAFVFVSQHLTDPTVLTDEFAIVMMMEATVAMMPRVLALNWTVEIDPRRELITSDVPVIPWRKPTFRDHHEGLGIDKAEELRFPLDPGKQLVMSRRQRPPAIEAHVHRVRRSNADLAAACHRFIVGSPNNSEVAAQRLDARRPALRFWTGPLYMPGADGAMERQDGEVIQVWVPRGSGYGVPGRRRGKRQVRPEP